MGNKDINFWIIEDYNESVSKKKFTNYKLLKLSLLFFIILDLKSIL